MQGGTDDTDSPNLKLWDGVGYVDYFFYEEDLIGNARCWGQDSIMADEVPVATGEGAFFKAINDCTITVAGQVASTTAMNVPLNPSVFNLIANPYPTAIDINSEKVYWGEAIVGGSDDTDSPNLKLWDGLGYVDYYFYEEDLIGNEKCWGQDSIMADETIVEPGHGFWLKYDLPNEPVDLKFDL